MKSRRTLWMPLGTFFSRVAASSWFEGNFFRSTGMRIFSAFASTSPTSTPPSWVKRIQSPCRTLAPSIQPASGVAYVSDGVDVDVVFGVGWVRHEWLDQELSEVACDRLYLLLFACSCCNPSLGFGPGLVECQKTA